ncbi:phosphopantetheine-binding protein [Polynucleobacter sp. AP-Sving-400A-A2]|uniref:phosphopantetheine-binding protein n=1 Tax=Polynucleobacter sp. AP-Sving-400A-A2 TaxID=2081049 RepID=UPI001BFE4A9A|nr:phosphopantetheine-binding protein [Polynucleobacter sp. AP-Sving-400A-A2]QWE14854.1 acyl carrier protein [Polynucleobacter sp. AP-Sving-400A-A2]
MEFFLSKLADLLEVDELSPSDNFCNFDAWDSLTILSIIAWCKADYNISLTSKEIIELQSPEKLFAFISSKSQN